MDHALTSYFIIAAVWIGMEHTAVCGLQSFRKGRGSSLLYFVFLLLCLFLVVPLVGLRSMIVELTGSTNLICKFHALPIVSF